VGERLHPSQYDEDLGELDEGEYDEQDLIDADADPDGNLRGFVVPDSVTPEPEEQEKDELDWADEQIEAQEKAKRKARLTSKYVKTPVSLVAPPLTVGAVIRSCLKKTKYRRTQMVMSPKKRIVKLARAPLRVRLIRRRLQKVSDRSSV
jgi:hypothetical protein